jgi:hypothetical protein
LKTAFDSGDAAIVAAALQNRDQNELMRTEAICNALELKVTKREELLQQVIFTVKSPCVKSICLMPF